MNFKKIKKNDIYYKVLKEYILLKIGWIKIMKPYLNIDEFLWFSKIIILKIKKEINDSIVKLFYLPQFINDNNYLVYLT
jgi:hypothetical protein